MSNGEAAFAAAAAVSENVLRKEITRLRSEVSRFREALGRISDRGPSRDPVPDILKYLHNETNPDETFSRGMDKAAYHSAEIARKALQEGEYP